MLCKLCHEEKPLLKKSHIIPTFLYKPLLGDSHRMVSINTNNLNDKRYLQTGYFDKDMLCEKCDNVVLGRLERYACNSIYTNNNANPEITTEFFKGSGTEIPNVRYSNLDYNTLKLFFLSMIWKAHHSKQQFFKDVNLSPHFEDEIRLMLKYNDAGDENAFSVTMLLVNTEGTRPSKSIFEPINQSLNKDTTYLFNINEIFYYYNLGATTADSLFSGKGIRKDGILEVFILKGDIARMFFDLYLGKKLLMKSNFKL